METKNRRQVPALIKELLEKPREFSFVQAVRLLCSQTASSRQEGEGDFPIRFRPKLSLDFPPTDIDAIDVIDDDKERYRITATFLGLYGTSSPLPAFYTEELLADATEDITIVRDFLDVFHTPLYRLFYRAATRYRLPLQVIEERDPDVLERLYSLLGYAGSGLRTSLPSSFRMLRYLGLFSHFPRSAEVLRSLVSDFAGSDRVRVEQCVVSRAPIPADQRCHLGTGSSRLGEDCYVGSSIGDRSGAFRLAVGPLDTKEWHDLMPGAHKAVLLQSTVQLYLDKPLRWDIEMTINPDDAGGVRLGTAPWSHLGRDSWLGRPDSCPSSSTVRFYPHQLNPALRQHTATL